MAITTYSLLYYLFFVNILCIVNNYNLYYQIKIHSIYNKFTETNPFSIVQNTLKDSIYVNHI